MNSKDIQDVRALKYFLGIEVAKSCTGIFLSQMKYIPSLLEETGNESQQILSYKTSFIRKYCVYYRVRNVFAED